MKEGTGQIQPVTITIRIPDRLVLAVRSVLTALRASAPTLGKYLSGKAPVSNWMVVLMVLFILTISFFFKLQSDNFNNVLRMAEDGQVIIQQQQEIIDSLAQGQPGPIHSGTPPY